MTNSFNPLIGRSIEEMRADLATQRAAAAPVVETALPGMGLVPRYEHVRTALLDHEHLSTKDNFLLARDSEPTPLLITQSDGERHTMLRDLLRPAFNRAAMKDAGPWIRELVDELLDQLPPGGPADVVGDIGVPLTAAVITRLIGVPGADAGRLVELTQALAEMVPANLFVTPEWAELEAYFRARSEERRLLSDKPQDVLTMLVDASVDGVPMSDREVAFHAFQLFAAGVESTSFTLGWTVHHLLVERERWDALRADRSLLALAREEGLRHCTAIRWVTRTAEEEVRLGSACVHAGERLLVSLESANLDEDAFGPDADRFDLHRESARKHVAFGHGVHLCLGAELSRLEIDAALDRLLDRMPDLRLAEPEAWDDLRNPLFSGPRSARVSW
ncbi:cytochrome P450 [Kribbella sp. NPDC051137]|uniref:cytochrome P450 n=1 Tax=Kribbella sp. NPDC051137 TaxID=3155045 RepID=UPI00343397D4